LQIRWTVEASSDLEQISLHIAEDNPEAALRIVDNMFQRIEQLVAFPNRGRIGREEGTRELVFSPLPYIAVYRVKESTVEILHIWHGAQNRNPSPEPE
jgi:toxin ParE1/3/4